MGAFLNRELKMAADERPVYMRVQNTYPEGENMVFIFANGKGVRVPVSAYETKGNRRKLTGAYSSASPIVGIFHEVEKNPFELMLVSDAERAIVFKTSLIPVKTTRTSAGVQVFTLKKGQKLVGAYSDFAERFEDTKGYKKIKIPATGILLSEKDIDKQQLKI
jgi:DNA gyrase subunit A